MKQSPAERLFTLTCYLLSTEIKGLSKQDIFRAVPGYQDSKTEDAANRLFERDKISLKEAGIQLEVISNFVSKTRKQLAIELQKNLSSGQKISS